MEGEGTAVISMAEIDTSAPFRSVREAVVLFGERVLGTEVYATTNLKEIQQEGDNGYMTSDDELEATKQSLQTELENSMKMASSLISVQEELQRTKTELEQLKTQELDLEKQRVWDFDSSTEEDVKFVEEEEEMEFQKKKCVRFANSPTIIAEVIVPKEEAVLQRHSSLKKKKKLRQIIPLIRGLFSNKRGSSQVAFA